MSTAARRAGNRTSVPVRGSGWAGITGTPVRPTVARAWAVTAEPSLSTAVAVTMSVWVAPGGPLKAPWNWQV